ncbi:MAG: hypothetical protein AUK64_2649, partial [bacterium P201]
LLVREKKHISALIRLFRVQNYVSFGIPARA